MTRPPGWSATHCKDCWRDNRGKNVYNSHNIGDTACPTGNKFGNFEVDDEEAEDWEKQDENEYKVEEQVSLNKVQTVHWSRLNDFNRLNDFMEKQGGFSSVNRVL